jgi:hypothetical protein
VLSRVGVSSCRSARCLPGSNRHCRRLCPQPNQFGEFVLFHQGVGINKVSTSTRTTRANLTKTYFASYMTYVYQTEQSYTSNDSKS